MEMEVQTCPRATGPWTSVVKITSRQTKEEQTFVSAPDAPLFAAFVWVLDQNSYHVTGGAHVKSLAMEGDSEESDQFRFLRAACLANL